jgi:hypothetical protein
VDQLKPRCGREGLWRWCKEEQVFHPSHRYRQFWIWCSKVKYLLTNYTHQSSWKMST